MSDDNVVWVISKGSYSDYRVMCACPSKGAATSVVKRYNEIEQDSYDQAIVESLPMISADVQRVEVLSLSVEILDDGTERANRESTRIEWPFDSIYPVQPVHWRWVRAPYIKHIGGRLDVSGTDHERVRKVFGDRRALIRSDAAARACVEIEGNR